jgi:hypothetical protein
MAILLHLASFHAVQGAIGMLTFIVANPTKFASGSLTFPAFICIGKVILTIVTEYCALMYLLYTDSSLAAIKLAPGLLIVATWDSKLIGIFPNDRSQKEMDDLPLEYVRAGGTKDSLRDAGNFMKEVTNKRLLGQVGNTFLVWTLAILNYVLGILYTTVYFYFTPFIPMIYVILESYTSRHSPQVGMEYLDS